MQFSVILGKMMYFYNVQRPVRLDLMNATDNLDNEKSAFIN